MKSNIVFIQLERQDIPPQGLSERLRSEGVLINAAGPRELRAVTNFNVTADDIDFILGSMSRVLSSNS